MTILSITDSDTGLAGVIPSMVYINTDDTYAKVTSAGYLNPVQQNGYVFSTYQMALVTTKANPNDFNVTTYLLQVQIAISGAITLVNTAASVSSGLTNQVAYYATSGSVVSGLPIVNSAGLLTSSGGVPGWVAYTGTGSPVLQTSPLILNPRINVIFDTNNNKILALFPVVGATNTFQIDNSVAGNPVLLTASSDVNTNISMTFRTSGTGKFTLLALNAGNNIIAEFIPSSVSSVNYFTIFSGDTGAHPTLRSFGADTNIGMNFVTKGTGGYDFYGNNATSLMFRISSPVIPTVNYLQLNVPVAGVGVNLQALGTDLNIDFNFTQKGLGRFAFFGFSGSTALLNVTGVASAVNYVRTINAVTTGSPRIVADGTDANITLIIGGKLTGGVDISGVTSGASSPAGFVGEVITANASNTSVSLTSDVDTNVLSIVLTAGDWDVCGDVVFSGTGTTSTVFNTGWTSITSATIPVGILTANQFYSSAGSLVYANTPSSTAAFVIPTQVYSFSSPTTVFLSVKSRFTVSTTTAGGFIIARRRR